MSFPFQSTHPRGVRPNHCRFYDRRETISIHAPTWGATTLFSSSSFFSSDFNPRTHVGCDFLFTYFVNSLRNFNPRTHVGCDVSLFFINQTCQNFNPRTHVGCDENALLAVWVIHTFQSTHPRGVRHTFIDDITDVIKFQSTHPRGVRPVMVRASPPLPYFNPRTHVGCDENASILRPRKSISIHAPTWGATPGLSTDLAAAVISIHAPTWGATAGHRRHHRDNPISIHAPTWGATASAS